MKKFSLLTVARRCLILVFFCFFSYLSTKAQTVTIGTSTATPTTTNRSPWYPYYGYSYVQTIYLQSEISATGNITSISYYYGGPSLDNSKQIKVYMAKVARSSFASTTDFEPLANLTLVFDGTVTATTLPGIVTITLSTPFPYNNVDNLLIAIDENTAGYENDVFVTTFRATTIGTNRVLSKYSDTVDPDPAAPGTANNRNSIVGNIQINGLSLVGCQPATGVAISGITNSSAVATWSAPAGGSAVSQYEWELRTSGAAGSGATGLVNSGTTASTSVNLSSLVSNTAHSFYIRTACTGSTFSAWSSAIAFTTPCGFPSYATIPYNQGFESWIDGPCGGTTAAPGPEWIPTPTTGDASWRRNDQGFTSAAWRYVNDDPAPFVAPTFSEGAYSARFHTYGSDHGTGTLLLGLNCSSASGPLQLSFDYRNPTGADSLVVSVSTDNGATFTRLDNLGVSSAWSNKSFVFTSTSAQTVIKLQAFSDFGNDDIGMDNLIVQPAPSCLPPTGLNITNITTTGGATFGWNAVTGAVNYEVVVSTSPSVPVTAGTSTSGALTYTFSGLAANTTNFAFVRASCGSGFSSWTSVQFSTTPNDNCSGAISVTQEANGSCTTIPVSTVAATQSSQAAPSCSSGFGYEDDVWYKFVATGTGAIIKLSNLTVISGVSTDVGSVVYTGSSCGALTEVAGSCSIGDGTTLTTDRSVAGLTIGQTYYVRLYGGGVSSNEVTFNMCISQPPAPPANDAPCNAIALTKDGPTVCGNTTNATSVSDPAFSQSTPNNTVWFTYTPTTTGVAAVTFTRPAGVTTNLLDGWLGIYTATGTCPTLTFTEVTGNALEFNLPTTATVTVTTTSLTAGTTYYFMIDGVVGAVGEFCIQVVTPPTPPVCATGLSPANNATNVTIPAATLSWNAVATATSYDVYFGSTNPPTTPTNVTGTSINATGLAASTPYYWYVVPKNGGGSATGCNTVFTFTTDAAPPAAPANDDCAGAINILGWANNLAGTTISSSQSVAPATCGTFTSSGAGDVWYKFTTQNAGSAIITVNGIDAVIEAFSGACGSLVSLGCADVSGTTETLNLTGLSAATTYYFRVYGYGSVSAAQGNFTVSTAGAALPVSIVSLKGERQGNNNVLSWITVTETNNAGFELQRSADGINFSGLSFIASQSANGNSNGNLVYTFTDTKSLTTGSYYRLKQVDKDGKSTVSSVVFIKGVKVSKLELASVYPNPVIDQLNVTVASPKVDRITFVVTDLAGKVIMSQLANVVNGDNNIKLNVSVLAKGTYTIKAVCADGCETAVSKFIKQ